MQTITFSSTGTLARGNGVGYGRASGSTSKNNSVPSGFKRRRRLGAASLLFAFLLAIVPSVNVLLKLHHSPSKDKEGLDGSNRSKWGEEKVESHSSPQQKFSGGEASFPGGQSGYVSPIPKESSKGSSRVGEVPSHRGVKLSRETVQRAYDRREKSPDHKTPKSSGKAGMSHVTHSEGTKSTLENSKHRNPSPRVEYGEKGGKIADGRDRCFVDVNGDHRCYPTVFFFGTSKCGTTSLARWLDRHPAINWVSNPRRPNEVEDTGVKEAHVFDDSPKGTANEMKKLHHEKLYVTSPKATAEDVVIDYSPHYIAVAEVPHRIADLYGSDAGLKFIVTLREPVSRTISSWEFKNMFNSKKQRREEMRSLTSAVEDGKKRAAKLEECISLAKTKKSSPRDRDLRLCNPRKFLELPLYVSHVGKSMYAQQLERWFDIFGRENFKVVFTDDMASNPVGVLEDVINFLGLDFADEDGAKNGLPTRSKWAWITTMAYNKTKSDKKNELQDQVTDEVKKELWEFFEPHNRRLEELLGGPIPDSWK